MVHRSKRHRDDKKSLKRGRTAEILTAYGLSLEDIGEYTPLRLELAAALSYPDGSMDGRALRRALRRHKLVIEQTAGKDYTTLAEITKLREMSRQAKPIGDETDKVAGKTSDISADFRNTKQMDAKKKREQNAKLLRAQHDSSRRERTDRLHKALLEERRGTRRSKTEQN